MEAPEYLHGGYCRAGTPQFAPEKKVVAGGGGGGGEHFMVEDLLDFSNEEDEAGLAAGGDDAGFDAPAGNSTDSSTVTAVDSCSNSFSGSDPHFSGDLVCRSFAGTSLSGGLCEPYDELAELEWLSNFVEESFSSEDLQKLQLISGIKSSSSSSENRAEISPPVGEGAAGRDAQPALFRPEAPVPGKARSKRSRAAPCSWSSRLLVLSPTTTASSPESELLVLAESSYGKKAAAKKKDPSARPAVAPAADGRRCLHCATDKTPQWRTGPMGPKTLCNACGVRYKSGRLVPEYRPAASPTFMLSKHSNSHRKVLELRRQKELQQQQQLLQAGSSAVYDGGADAAGDDFLIHHHLGPDFRQLI
ncbi:GATA transcription factor 12-like [Phoenix dactylifera]|uniref:GATA transcription factor n=1 Tax=Phoenix dactylifera TaxID=42345 RepID=A0A8B7D0H8_PHODC|nr:GATA transcription factor 12-like [Phoenix dactylifera]